MPLPSLSAAKKRRLSPLLALVAGLCYPLAFAPWNQAWLLLISLVLLWWCLEDSSPKQAAKLGFVFGIGQFGLGVSWVYVSMATFGGTGPLISGLMTAVFVLLLALFPALACWLGVWLSRRSRSGLLSPLLFIVSWMAIDWLRGWVLCGFPWIYPGYAAIDTPLAQLAAYGGVWLVSIVILATALSLAQLATRRLEPIVILLAVAGWLAAFVLPVTPGVKPIDQPKPVALVQGNIPISVKWQLSQRQQTRDIFARLTASIDNKQSLVIWSESALTEFYRDAKPWLKQQAAPFDKAGGALIVGLPRYRFDPLFRPIFYNSVVVVDGGNGIYNKQKLVPFGEYVPFEDLIRGLVPFFNLPMSSFTAGMPSQPPLTVQGIKIAAFVCYDILFPGLVADDAKGSHVLLEVSDDAWFGDSAGPWQHFQMSRMRSIETGRYLLRDTNSGITAIVDAQGRIQEKLPEFERAILKGHYQPMTGQTPYMTWGRWLAPAITLILLLLGLCLRSRHD